MSNVAKLAQWEWFKLQRRWMPWILLGILLLFSQLVVWGRFFSYNNLQDHLQDSGIVVPLFGTGDPGPQGRLQVISIASCNVLETDPSAILPVGTPSKVVADLLTRCQQLQAQLQRQYEGFTLPGSLPSAFEIARAIGLILFAILTASAIGSDYGLGTLRPILTRGVGRLPYLAGKFLMLIGAAAGALIVVGIATAVSSLIATGITETPAGGAAAATTWADAGIAIGKTWISLIPYIALTATVTIWMRSAAAGMGIGLGYYFAEGLLTALLSTLFDWFRTIDDYLLIRNIDAFADGSLSFGSGSINSAIGVGQAAIILALYTVALAGIAIRLFRQRDVTGASGG